MPAHLMRSDIQWSRDTADICLDPTIPGVRLVHRAHGHIYIEPRYLHFSFQRLGYKRKRCDWIRDQYAKVARAGIPDTHFMRGSGDDGALAFDSISALGFIVLLVEMLNAGNAASSLCQTCSMNTLRTIAQHASIQLRLAPTLGPIEVTIIHGALNVQLVIGRTYGKVNGWGDVMDATPGAAALWQSCCATGVLSSQITSDYATPLFHEVVQFCAVATHMLSKLLGGNQIMVTVLGCIVPIVTELFETRIVGLAITSTPPTLPPLLRTSQNRPSLIDPFVAVHLLERARELGTVPKQVLRFNNDRAEFAGLSHHCADLWWFKELCMYNRNLKSKFAGIKQFSMATDPSTYNGEETLVSQVYAHSVDTCANAMIKIIPKGKHIAVNEFPMTDGFAALVLQRKQERWAAFKELRAISAQLHALSGGRRTSWYIRGCVGVGEVGTPATPTRGGLGGVRGWVGGWLLQNNPQQCWGGLVCRRVGGWGGWLGG